SVNCDVRSNVGEGLHEESFLGNAHIGMHSGYNGAAAYNSCRHTAKNAYINCYQEGSNKKHPVILSAGDVALGGVSFLPDTITTTPEGGRLMVINPSCSSLPIDVGATEVTIGGDSVLMFRPRQGQPYRVKFDERSKVLMLNWA